MKQYLKYYLVSPVLLIIFSLYAPVGTAKSKTDVIYGEDNRRDAYEVSKIWQDRADSTVALFGRSWLTDLKNGYTQILTESYSEKYNLCATERFIDQNTGSYCSGSLVAPNIVMTAGHCITDDYDCSQTQFVFGFAVKQIGIEPTEVSNSEVYSCKSVIWSMEQAEGADFALVYLDRPVVGHKPLKLASKTSAENDSVVVIGYPSGLPVKVADGANVRTVNPNFFVANLDTYVGNSGSAVFSDTTGDVVGVLVRGEADFVPKGSCNVSYVCDESGCRGEDVTRIDQITPYLP